MTFPHFFSEVPFSSSVIVIAIIARRVIVIDQDRTHQETFLTTNDVQID